MWLAILHSYKCDLIEAVYSERMMDYCYKNKISPSDFNKKRKTSMEVFTVRQLTNWINSNWTEHVCDMAGVGYEGVKRSFFNKLDELRSENEQGNIHKGTIIVR